MKQTLSIVSLGLVAASVAAQNIVVDPTTQTATISPGSFVNAFSIPFEGEPFDTVINLATFSVANPPVPYALQLNDNNNSKPVVGENAPGFTLTIQAPVTLNGANTSNVLPNPNPPTATGPLPPINSGAAAVLLSVVGGNAPGGTSSQNPNGSTGGSVTSPVVVNQASTVSLLGAVTFGGAAVSADSLGGTGGAGYSPGSPIVESAGNGGAGGNGGVTNASNTGSIAVGSPVSPVTANADTFGLRAVSGGGAGGAGGNENPAFGVVGNGGAGGNGGSGGAVSITQSGSIAVYANRGAAIFGLSRGGAGGTGGTASGLGSFGGNGLAGGSAGNVTTTLTGGSSIVTNGDTMSGVLAKSVGGIGGIGGDSFNFAGTGPSGGSGGNSGLVTIQTDTSASVLTLGNNSPGLVGASLSGDGGPGGSDTAITVGKSGPGGAGGNAGINVAGAFQAVSVSHAGTVQTQGGASIGIVAQALSGVGGAGGTGSGLIYASGSNSSVSGIVGSVSVTNSGKILTGFQSVPQTLNLSSSPLPGQASHGILAQSVAGGGGAAGSTQLGLVSLGGNGLINPITANGGDVVVNPGGSIQTGGLGAIGVVAQSVGGGGGDGGSSTSLLVGIGGNGGAGGSGGAVTINGNGGSIETFALRSHGLVAQSVGGGGGNGGDALVTTAVFGYAVGGNTTNAGAGGSVSANLSNFSINTSGGKSAGAVAQSIGGGGGTGGSAYALSSGELIAGGVAIGGSGGAGGDGGGVTMQLSKTTIQTGTRAFNPNGIGILPADSHGVIAQSIGGGGGVGGSAMATAWAIAPPTPLIQASIAFTYSAGGTGGLGGDGGTVEVVLNDGTIISTGGQGSIGVLAQSIGGGGGAGGDSSTLAAAFANARDIEDDDTPFGVNVTTTLGIAAKGTGNTGGNAGEVSVAIGDTTSSPVSIGTSGDYANGVVAQSIAGGGGNAGLGSSRTQAPGNSFGLNVNLLLGARGGVGGSSNFVEVGLAPGSSILTAGSSAHGIVAQSIAGGGGTSQAGSYNLGIVATPGSFGLTGTVGLELGVNGGDGGGAGQAYVDNAGSITTLGDDASAILVQSIGGGGGLAGSAGDDASADNPVVDRLLGTREFVTNQILGVIPINFTLTISLGGNGGNGGNSQGAEVHSGGVITTSGDWSHGIVIQSIGGGGGKGGTAAAKGASNLNAIDFNLGYASGGDGGSAGNAGTVLVSLEGGSITTGALIQGSSAPLAGFSAFGVLAQSIGGGGGLAADGSVESAGVVTLGMTSNGSGGSGGNGGNINVSMNTDKSSISTAGWGAHAIVLQSIGGGGGVGGAGNSASVGLTPTGGGVEIEVGGGPTAAGSGGSINFGYQSNVPISISTSGDNAFGVLAQSVGGGGGLGFALNPSQKISIGGSQTATPASGGQVTISLLTGSQILTSGTGSHGIVAQSIGGGGGIAGYPTGTASLAYLDDGSLPSQRTNGNGNTVVLNIDATIQTTGAAAHGIIAQSIGGGGGMLGTGSTLYLGSIGQPGSIGFGGSVDVTQAGIIQVFGENSIGIIAQSDGVLNSADANDSPVTITVNGSIQGGSGAEGAGILVLNGNDSNQVNIGKTGSVGALSGNAIVYRGISKLDVLNQGTLTGSVTLGVGGTLTNQGTFSSGAIVAGNMINQGVVSPGSSPGTLIVTGDYTQTSDGTLIIEIADSDQMDRLEVGGRAKLGGTVILVPYEGFAWELGESYAFLEAESVEGEFDRILAPEGFRGRLLLADGLASFLIGPASYTQLAATRNQFEVATALDQFLTPTSTDQNVVATTLDSLAPEAYQPAFDQIAPTLYESLPSLVLEQGFLQSQFLAQRMSSVRFGVGGFSVSGMDFAPIQSTDPNESPLVSANSGPSPWSAWIQANGIFAKTTSVNQVPTYRVDSGGVLFGADFAWSEQFATGVYAGYQGTFANYADDSNADVQSALLGVYATYESDGFYADAILGGSYNGYNVRRSIEFGELDRTARSQPNGGQLQTYLGTGYDWEAGGFTFGPTLSGQYSFTGIAPVTEFGADSLNLSVGSQALNSLRTNLGARVAYTWKAGPSLAIIPEIRLSWQHEFLNNPRTISASLDGGSGIPFDYETAAPGRDSLFGGAGVSFQFGENLNGYAFYNIDGGRPDYLGQSVSAGFQIRF